ncbi:TauD/TfdA family dioxygenase [Dyella flagellata]|uniref:TauD/TfdA-like domain-containing protein n=2 Tax=Dyella flagellata TaxID=1867833 RepID=A0ABQ5X9H4_9GAMM|nr:hypothetical protein GCM10007898_14800 [Dyella flagellata]
MDRQHDKSTALKARLLQAGKPAATRIDAEVRGRLPRIIHAEADRSLERWLLAHADMLQTLLHTVGGVLFRGFEVDGVDAFRAVCMRCIDELIPYQERSTPREERGGRVYTSTAYPSEQTIALHNEFSYALNWPMRICFYAQQVAAQGGETPIADGRSVYQGIAPEVRDSFVRKGVMYVRRYGWGVDLSWQETFGTADPRVVEEYCQAHDIHYEWDGEKLTTRQVRQAVTHHPVTGETVWFNQAHLFHASNLPVEVHESIRRVMHGTFPREALYGDGTPIEPESLAQIRAAFEAAKVVFPWERHDVLLLDNVLINHGRNPYQGVRSILVAMGQLSQSSSVAQGAF